MIAVDGIILVISCQKHLLTRLKEINLQENYENWKVIKVIGDLFLDCDYKLEGNLMTIKCEESYLHLMKKLVLSFQYLYEIFDIKEGILKCNDDLLFNENNLETFLKSPKKHKINDNEYIDIDYIGRSCVAPGTTTSHLLEYYQNHQEDIDNPQHNLKGVDIAKFSKFTHKDPKYIAGPITYFSNKSCKILINHMNNINYNIHHYDEKTDSYPYGIDDIVIASILRENNIKLLHSDIFYNNMTNNIKEYIDENNKIAFHTNKYK
jgi:Galactosyltransferase